MAHARVLSVDVPEASALLLPAYWYHEVRSLSGGASGLNIAVNFWFDTAAPATVLHSVMREPRHGLYASAAAAAAAPD